MNEELARLQTALEHAPANPGPIAPGLKGWNTEAGYVCALCAGRIMARGCSIGKPVTPIWDDNKGKTCVLCNK